MQRHIAHIWRNPKHRTYDAYWAVDDVDQHKQICADAPSVPTGQKCKEHSDGIPQNARLRVAPFDDEEILGAAWRQLEFGH